MTAKHDKLHLIENCDVLFEKPLPNRKNRSLESIHLKSIKKDDKVKKKVSAPKITTGEEIKSNKEQPYSSLVVSTSSIHVGDPVTAAEERQRNGRYLAVGLTLIMLFIAFYHTVMRQTPVLAGLLPPAIIMVLYILWLLYFAKKRKRIQITAV